MNNDKFDEFLDDATHDAADRWQKAGGKRLNTEELYALNDLLTAYFNDKRPR